MIMVNNNGGAGSWGFMNHAQWNGLTPTDLVFPTFVFVMGASIAYAFEARLARGATRAQLAWHTLKRAAILFLLGIVVNGFPFLELAHLRIYGVLQRIAICYLLVGLFYLWDKRVWTKVAALVAALVGYWILLRWVPVPGAGMPGRDIPFMDQNLNLVSWIDQHIFPGHLYLTWDTHNLRDPEGLLSTLPALGTTLLGLLTGLWLRTRKPVAAKALGLAVGSVACLALITSGPSGFRSIKTCGPVPMCWWRPAGRWPCWHWPSGRPTCTAGAGAGPGHGWCWDQTP
jgi:predicted acyltransferase